MIIQGADSVPSGRLGDQNLLLLGGVSSLVENSSVFLGHAPGRRGARGIRELAPGTLIVIDEASMMSVQDLADIIGYAAAHHCKVIVAGDPEQLTAVEGGGAMMLLARHLGHVQLAEAVRFQAGWEQQASLRLRAGDLSALDAYDGHGRIRGGEPDQVMDQAREMYVAHYLAGTDVELIAWERDRCREMSRRIRDDLIHLGQVERGREVRLAQGAKASVGDLIICRTNDHNLEAGQAGRTLANGDVLRIDAIGADGSLTVRRAIDRDAATGQRRWTKRAFAYRGYGTADLGYAITGHAAQGRTVTIGIPLVTGGESRQWLYSAMTRGALANIAHVFTRPVRLPDPSPAPARRPNWLAINDCSASEMVCLPCRPSPYAGRIRVRPRRSWPTSCKGTAATCPRWRPSGATSSTLTTWPSSTPSGRIRQRACRPSATGRSYGPHCLRGMSRRSSTLPRPPGCGGRCALPRPPAWTPPRSLTARSRDGP